MIEALAMLSNEARECADEVYALGTYLWLFPNTVRYGKRRPGQWTDATRDKRRKRADREWWRRALNVWHLKQGNRAERRREHRDQRISNGMAPVHRHVRCNGCAVSDALRPSRAARRGSARA